ncbi:MAG: hypothetical protein LBF90_00200 [Prevotellaceae bacterium]|jgi:hypothetical protein|nr:hypothetical protein [Prevotellaceae bacterium]
MYITGTKIKTPLRSAAPCTKVKNGCFIPKKRRTIPTKIKKLQLIPLLCLAALPVWEQSMAHVTPPNIAAGAVPTQTFHAGLPRPALSNRCDTAWRFADYRTVNPTACPDASGMPTAPVDGVPCRLNDGARQIDSTSIINDRTMVINDKPAVINAP